MDALHSAMAFSSFFFTASNARSLSLLRVDSPLPPPIIEAMNIIFEARLSDYNAGRKHADLGLPDEFSGMRRQWSFSWKLTGVCRKPHPTVC